MCLYLSFPADHLTDTTSPTRQLYGVPSLGTLARTVALPKPEPSGNAPSAQLDMAEVESRRDLTACCSHVFLDDQWMGPATICAIAVDITAVGAVPCSTIVADLCNLLGHPPLLLCLTCARKPAGFIGSTISLSIIVACIVVT